MPAKTLHVYRSDAGWEVKKEGRRPRTFRTKRDALAMAIHQVRNAGAGQIAVHRPDGRIVEHRTYGMPKVQQPRGKSSLGDTKIAKAVAKVVLDRLKSDSFPRRAHAPAK